MVDSEKQSDLNVRGLSLIDVSSEDDCLIDSPLCDPINPQSSEKGSETKTVRFTMDSESVEISLGSQEEEGKAKEPSDSSEHDKPRKNGKYNLRKSLAWDSAFFTSEGFLEPEELSSMLGGNEKDRLQTLPGIQEDVNKSYDSLTTLDSETLTLESLEADLFEDVRASIQKSNNVSITANSSGKELKPTKTKNVSCSKKVELTTQDKMKQKATPKKPNVGVKDSGKTLKQVVIRPQISQTVQSVARSETTSSLHKPPKILSSAGLTPTKRASLGAKNVKMEKDARTTTGRGTTVPKAPALGGARNFVPRPKPSSIPSSCSPASSKTELTSSCSSLESCTSVSTNRINKSSLNSIKHKHGSRIVNPSSVKTVTNQSKIAPKGKIQAGSSKVPTFLKSSAKISPSISPTSSIGEWSSESSSSVFASNQSSKVVRASLGTGSRKGLTTNCDAHQVQVEGAEVTGSHDESENKVSAGASKLLNSASMKPSGLRMPSPKLGFFDGVRSSGRTPNGSMLSHPGVPSGLPKIGAKSSSPRGISNKANSGKLHSVRALDAIQSPKVDVKQTSSAVKSRSSLSIQKSLISASGAPSSSKTLKTSPGISPKLQNKSSPGTGRERYSKARGIGLTEKEVDQGSKDGARIKDTKIVPLDGITERSADIACKSDVQNKIASKEADENETHSYPCLKTDTVFLYNTNKKEEAPVEDQISSVQQEPVADSHLSHYHKEFENSFVDTKIVPLDKATETTAHTASKADVQNTIASKQTAENETYSYPCLETDIVSLPETNKKEEAPVEDQSGAVQKELIGDSHSSHCNKESHNGLSNPSSMTSDVTCDSRIPFSVKDSFYNMDTSLDVLSGLEVVREKTMISPFPESTFPENNG